MWNSILFNTCGTLGVLSMILGVSLFPWIFNRKIIPEIERKVGKKLEWSRSYDHAVNPLGSFGSRILGRYSEIMYYIAVKFLLSKFCADKSYFKIFRFFVLTKASYQTEQFTRREIIWSLLALINVVIFFVSGIVFCFMPS